MRLSERKKVDFPHPVGPMRAATVWGANARLTSVSTVFAPKPRVTSRAVITGASSTPTAVRGDEVLGAVLAVVGAPPSGEVDAVGEPEARPNSSVPKLPPLICREPTEGR